MDKKTCRICLCGCSKKPSLFEMHNGSRYSDIIQEYIGIEFIKKVNLPTGLCKNCENDIKNIVKFITKVKLSSEKLRDALIWNVPFVANNAIKQENINDFNFVNIFVQEDGNDWISSEAFHNALSDDDDSEAEISLHDLKNKNVDQMGVHKSGCNLDDITNELIEAEHSIKLEEVDHDFNDVGLVKVKKSKRKHILSKRHSIQYKKKHCEPSSELLNLDIKEEDILCNLKDEIENALLNSNDKKIEGTLKPGIDIENKYEILNKNDHVLKKDMYKCLTCGILSVNKSAFIVHYRKHSGERPHCCKFCKMKYTQTGTLNAHLKKRHYKEWIKMKLVARKVKELKEQEYLEQCKIQEETKDTNNGEIVERRIICHICGRSYNHKYGLNLHMKVHNVHQQLQCQYCPQKFVRTGDRILHIRIHHTGEKPYCCHVCGKKFPSGTNLKKHLVAHSEERKFKCPICQKAMKSKDNLKRHILVMHEGTKSKICHVCGKGFALQYRLNVHMKNWHDNKRTSATCEICNKSYRNIEKHMKRHMDIKPFRCSMCHKSFLQEKHLFIHVKKHENETATFKCSYENCTSAFVKKCMLEYHILKYHLKHTPYVCQFCERGFYRSKDLGRHMKLKHNTQLDCTTIKEGL